MTPVATTPATTPDDNRLEPSHAALAAPALLPRDHLVDCGYPDAETLVERAPHYGVHIVGPVAADPRWQAREGTGYDQSACTINWDTQTATCPHGKQRRKWQPATAVAGQEGIQIRLAKKDGQACPVRSACPRAKTEPRPITVRTQPYDEALHAARHNQTTAAFKAQYATRAGIASTLSQGVRAFDLRRSRSIGLAKTHLQHMLITIGINLKRVMAWLTHPQPTKPYISPFAVLVSSG
jgi:transposase